MQSRSLIRLRLWIVAAVLAVVAGCGGSAPSASPDASAGASTGASSSPAASSNEPVTIKVWDQFSSEERSKAAEQIYANFKTANPNVTIEREVFTADQIKETGKLRMASGEGPDLVYLDVGPAVAGVFQEAGLLMPLSDVPNLNTDDVVVPWALDNGKLKGIPYGVPTEFEYVGVYYNETLIDAAGLTIPATAADIPAFCQGARDKGYVPFAIGNSPGFQSYWYMDLVINNAVGAEGIDTLLHQPGGRWDTPEIIAAVELFYQGMRKAGCYPDDANAIPYPDQNQPFLTGKALALPMGSWLIADVNAALPDAKISLRFFPKIKDSIAPAYSGSGWYVSSKTQHAAEVGKLLTAIHSPEAIKLWLDAGLIPAVKFDYASADVNPLLSTALNELGPTLAGEGSGLGQGITLNASEQFVTVLQDGMQAVFADTKTVTQVLEEMQAAWKPVQLR